MAGQVMFFPLKWEPGFERRQELKLMQVRLAELRARLQNDTRNLSPDQAWLCKQRFHNHLRSKIAIAPPGPALPIFKVFG